MNRFLKNFSGHNAPINALAVNEDGVAVSCGDNGSLSFWDYESGYCFQKSNTIVQPGRERMQLTCCGRFSALTCTNSLSFISRQDLWTPSAASTQRVLICREGTDVIAHSGLSLFGSQT